MHDLAKLPVLLSMFFVAWLLWDGWQTGEVWVKGGEPDALTRKLDMQSFAHKVSREERPFVYWLNMALFTVVEGLGLVLLIAP